MSARPDVNLKAQPRERAMASSNSTSGTTVPQCSAYPVSEYNAADAAKFDPRKWSYYKDLWPSVLPGWVVGGVCLAAALLFLLWLMSLCCRRRHVWRSGYVTLQDGPPGALPVTQRPRRRCCSAINVLIFLLAAATVGLAAWALAESIVLTHNRAADVWTVVADAQANLQALVNTGQAILSNLSSVEMAVAALQAAGGLPAEVSSSGLSSVASSLGSIIPTGEAQLARLQADGLDAIQNFTNTYKHPTTQATNLWVPIVMAVLFGLLILLTIFTAAAVMRIRFPRTASAAVLLLWLLVALIMFFGAGVMNGAKAFSKDSCLYTEDFAYRLIAQKASGTEQQRITAGLEYYMGRLNLTDAEVGPTIYGINITDVSGVLNNTEVQAVSEFLASSTGQSFLQASTSLNATSDTLLGSLPSVLAALRNQTALLQAEWNQDAFYPLYTQAKNLLCCNFAHAFHLLWLAWTICGCVAAVLLALLTLRITTFVVRAGTAEAVGGRFRRRGREMNLQQGPPQGQFITGAPVTAYPTPYRSTTPPLTASTVPNGNAPIAYERPIV